MFKPPYHSVVEFAQAHSSELDRKARLLLSIYHQFEFINKHMMIYGLIAIVIPAEVVIFILPQVTVKMVIALSMFNFILATVGAVGCAWAKTALSNHIRKTQNIG